MSLIPVMMKLQNIHLCFGNLLSHWYDFVLDFLTKFRAHILETS